MNVIIGLKDLRERMDHYAQKVKQGHSFIVMKRSQPLFTISPVENDEQWEQVIDFTKIKKGGVHIDDILSRL